MTEDQPLATWTAARSAGMVAVPGRLELTKTHIVFEPKGKRTQGARFSVQHRYVSAVGTAPGTGKFWSGGKQDRLCLTLSDGSEALFVVPDAEAVADRIRTQWVTKA